MKGDGASAAVDVEIRHEVNFPAVRDDNVQWKPPGSLADKVGSQGDASVEVSVTSLLLLGVLPLAVVVCCCMWLRRRCSRHHHPGNDEYESDYDILLDEERADELASSVSRVVGYEILADGRVLYNCLDGQGEELTLARRDLMDGATTEAMVHEYEHRYPPPWRRHH